MISLLVQLYITGFLALLGFLFGLQGTYIYSSMRPFATLNAKFNITILTLAIFSYIFVTLFFYLTSCGRYPYGNCTFSDFYYLILFSVHLMGFVILTTYLGVIIGFAISGNKSKDLSESKSEGEAAEKRTSE